LLRVRELTTGLRNRTLCEKNETGISGIIYCNLSNYTTIIDFRASAYISRSPPRIVAVIDGVIRTISELISHGDALLIGLMIMLTLALIGTFSPPIGIILGVLGIVVGKLVGLVVITISSIMGIVILAIYYNKDERRLNGNIQT